MLAHLFNLLGRAFAAIPPTLGSNWFGLVFTVIIILIGEGIGLYFFGWQAMKANLKRATGIGFAALGVGYTLVFAWCVVTTTFNDHIALATRVHDLHSAVDGDKAHEVASIQEVRTSLGGQLSELKEKCAKTEGANGILAKQAADQQGTINNCQSQAIKLMEPTAFSYDAMPFESTPENGNQKSTWLIVTNKSQTPVLFTVTCTSEILSLDAGIVAQQYAGRASRYTDKEWTFRISSPAWTPHAPIVVHTVTKGEGVLSCEYGAKGTDLK